jgi:hypothetical protein
MAVKKGASAFAGSNGAQQGAGSSSVDSYVVTMKKFAIGRF